LRWFMTKDLDSWFRSNSDDTNDFFRRKLKKTLKKKHKKKKIQKN
jgi:hypothetical protein